MDSFARLAIIEGLIPAERTTSPRAGEDTRRYAAYFPSQASLWAKSSETDACSTWTFSASGLPHSGSSSNTSLEIEIEASSPAKQIVDRYRALHSCEDINDLTTTRSSTPSAYSEDDSWETASLYDSSTSHPRTLKAVYRQSRHEALLIAFQEAVNIVKTCGLGPHQKIACQRSGCRDWLPDAKALAYHLHIHDIHDRSVDCPRCKDRFEDRTALHLHQCNKPHGFSIYSISASPLRQGLQRVKSLLQDLSSMKKVLL